MRPIRRVFAGTPEELDHLMEDARGRIREMLRLTMTLRAVSGPQLAHALGITSQSVYNRLNGSVAIPAEELVAFAQVLGVEPAWFFRSPDEAVSRALDEPTEVPAARQEAAGSFSVYCRSKRIKPATRSLLKDLLGMVDPETGALEGVSLAELAVKLGYGTRSGPRTISGRLRELEEAGAAKFERTPGHAGSIEILDYEALRSMHV